MQRSAWFGLTFAVALAAQAWPANALHDESLNRQLLKLAPATRLEQTCDTEVMRRINKADNPFSVDKVIAYTFADPVIGRNEITADGAAFRSRRDWYRLSYHCETDPRHLDARELDYRIGAKIPRKLWRELSLYD